jgi:hypothetical protein
MQVADQLGCGYWRLVAVLRARKIPPPQKTASGDFAWTAQDVERARKALKIDRPLKEHREVASS